MAQCLDVINIRGFMQLIKKHSGLFIGIVMGLYIVACAPVNFERNIKCGVGCVGISGNKVNYSELTTFGGGKVDILLVDDNSASMSTEQKAMANRMGNFLSVLDAAQVDYRIAITTTDVSATVGNGPRPINQNGALQDGKLITFGDGSRYITPQSANKLTLFSNDIVRQETLSCESNLAAHPMISSQIEYDGYCPSADERGVYAANLTIQNNSSGFVRSDAALAIVFLSDEDVRSGFYATRSDYPLDTNDQPQTLINNIQNIYAGKNFVAHSIIVKPNDSACLQIQRSQPNSVSGSYGQKYAEASNLTGGVVGDICASDYGSQLSAIGTQVTRQTNSVVLQCSNPQSLVVTVNGTISTAYQVVGTQVQFNQILPAGTTIKAEYSCLQ